MGKKLSFLVIVLSLVLLSACSQPQAQQQTSNSAPKASARNNTNTHLRATIHTTQPMAQIPQVKIPPHVVVATHQPAPAPASTPVPTPALAIAPANVAVGQGIGPAPYGAAPGMTAEETQLTQKLFALINSDRAARGLYPFTWNATLAGGARLHSWNMFHCGFSHTCPDGVPQCTRIANEGFAGYSDCGENIAEAGPYPTAWQGVYNIQEGMMHEGPTGWHFIHLTSTTLHRVGVGVFVDPSGQIWFTEDMVS
ncbi:MAG TPA: CAP domain-containing protein [Ktedonobacteraceae bacterium]|nr:CAP domain-containing protein [Ktedonobacteraceae bacterium]